MAIENRSGAFAEQLIKAFKEDGEDIGRPATLQDVCAVVGSAAENIIREREERHRDEVIEVVAHDLENNGKLRRVLGV